MKASSKRARSARRVSRLVLLACFALAFARLKNAGKLRLFWRLAFSPSLIQRKISQNQWFNHDDKEKRQIYSRRLLCCRSFSLVNGNNVLTTSRTHSSYSRRRHFCRRKFTIIRELSEIRNRAKRLCKKIIFVCVLYICVYSACGKLNRSSYSTWREFWIQLRDREWWPAQ